MRRDLLPTAVLAIAAILAGWLGWSGDLLLLPASCAFALIWSKAQNRLAVLIVSAGYFLTASRGLLHGVQHFYSTDVWSGLIFWLAASVSFVLVHLAAWSKRQAWRPLGFLVAMLLMVIPPFGITGWAHPLTASGVLFPGWGWWGLAAMTAGLMGLATRMGPAVAVALAGFWLWSAAIWTDPKVPLPWRGVELEMGSSLGRDASLGRQRDLIATVHSAASQGASLIVLPESALGFWTPTLSTLWRESLQGSAVTVIAGAAALDPAGYDNVLLMIDGGGSDILYRARMPVPVSMWRPWGPWFGEQGGARAHFFSNPVVEVGGRRVAPLICYEQLLVWPVLQSMLAGADIIVAVGNGWWTAGSSIVEIQRANMIAWASLFGTPLVISFNS
ncbi:conjugal transfer protein TraB [Ensifer adhaerens]|uniref:conjugal transfer protein TraB n=1 Tax=Ensifer adhaerens TaxID=106592 RepID=UPI00080730A0|nr:conjugal transfer protein TraB [Ensifer adhaerens]